MKFTSISSISLLATSLLFAGPNEDPHASMQIALDRANALRLAAEEKTEYEKTCNANLRSSLATANDERKLAETKLNSVQIENRTLQRKVEELQRLLKEEQIYNRNHNSHAIRTANDARAQLERLLDQEKQHNKNLRAALERANAEKREFERLLSEEKKFIQNVREALTHTNASLAEEKERNQNLRYALIRANAEIRQLKAYGDFWR